jgi:hypothetical protein
MRAVLLFAGSRWEPLPDQVQALCAGLAARCEPACGTCALD